MLRSVLTCAPHETECGLRTWERDLQVQSAATILFEPLQVVRRHLSTAMPELKCKTWYRWRAREHFNYQTLSKQDLGAASKPSQDACAAHQTRSRMQATPAPARQPRPSRTLNLSKSRKVLGAATGALERSTVARQCREVMLLRNARIWASKPIKTSTIVNGDTAAKLLKIALCSAFQHCRWWLLLLQSASHNSTQTRRVNPPAAERGTRLAVSFSIGAIRCSSCRSLQQCPSTACKSLR